MDAAKVFRVLSLIPDRVSFSTSGGVCTARAACQHPDRLAFLASRAHWLGPLEAISKDEQRMLGLQAAHGRPPQPIGDEPAEDASLEDAGLEIDELEVDELEDGELDVAERLEAEPERKPQP